MERPQTFTLCREHTPHVYGSKAGCKAISLRMKLQRRGYYARQYQGRVTTTAPPELVAELRK